MLYEGDFRTPPGRFALIAARFNAVVVDLLVAGALDALKRHGVAEGNVDVVKVPGSFEIPVVAQRLGKSGKYAAVGWKTYFDTGLEVEKGQPLEVSATGQIDLHAASPKQFVFGPNGGGTQVAGPGHRLANNDFRGGGLGAEGYGPLYTSGALYGRIGASGPLFKIGDKLTVPKATDAGRLYLIIAPSTYGASKGEFEVKVRLGK